jgi:hypothetical protein
MREFLRGSGLATAPCTGEQLHLPTSRMLHISPYCAKTMAADTHATTVEDNRDWTYNQKAAVVTQLSIDSDIRLLVLSYQGSSVKMLSSLLWCPRWSPKLRGSRSLNLKVPSTTIKQPQLPRSKAQATTMSHSVLACQKGSPASITTMMLLRQHGAKYGPDLGPTCVRDT